MEMMAGKTEITVGTRIRITRADGDPELIGETGEITHPFPGITSPGYTYVAGVYLDKHGLYALNQINLTSEDTFEVI